MSKSAPRLRAGWRALLFFIILFVMVEGLLPYVLFAGRKLFGPGETPEAVFLQKVFLFGCTLMLTLLTGKLERKSLADYGLPFRTAFGKDFWAGALWGFGILSVNIALMVVFRAYSFGSITLPILGLVEYALLWGVAYLAVGIAEEFAFRGYLQYTLTQGIGFWPAAIVTSILFGLIHVDVHASWESIANIAVLALLACMALRRTGSLWFPIGCHAAFDWGDTFFFASDRAQVHGHLFNASLHGANWLTGGDDGAVGNVFNVFLVFGGLLVLSKVYPHVKYPPRPTPATAETS